MEFKNKIAVYSLLGYFFERTLLRQNKEYIFQIIFLGYVSLDLG